MRRQYIAVLAVLLLCLAAVPGAAASWGGPAEAAAERLRSIEPAPPGAQKDPSEVPSDGGTVRYAQEGSGPGQAELRVTVPETPPKAGETFTVAVDISGNPGFAAVQFTLPYDKEAMECTSANPGDLMKGMLAASNNSAPEGAIVAGAAVDDVRGDGRLAVFTFTAKKDLASCDFRLEDILLTNVDDADINCTVNQKTAEAPAPPEEQRDLEKEAEDVMAELEGKTPQRPAENPSQIPPAEQQPQIPAAPTFTDVSGHWAEADILRAAELGLIGGYEDGTFKPDNSLTRAQFVTILYRQAGRPAVTEAAPFTDIANVNDEFKNAIAWASGQGLVGGYDDGTFRPQGVLSRQATMKILFQHSGGNAGAELMFYSVYDGTFPDSAKLADWARAPVYWGIYNSLIEAGDGNNLNPAQPMTRGQLARSMVRYMEKYGEEEIR